MSEPELVDINPENISEYPPRCFLKPDNEGLKIKLNWLKERFSEGMKIKQLYQDKKLIGFIEYAPGEYAWRAVDAKDYMFIHCIWIYPNKNKKLGYGSRLIQEAVKDAEKEGKLGVVVVTSDRSFIANKEVFVKNGFKEIEKSSNNYELMVKEIKKGPLPKFKDWEKELSKYKDGLHILYSYQCPWVARSIADNMLDIAKQEGYKANIIELKSAEEAQNGPSVYSAFSVIYNGKLIEDHFTSARRFQNIIKKELK